MRISEDEFALDVIDGEPAIITQASVIGQPGSEWEGSPIFKKTYLLELISRSLEHEVIKPEDIQSLIRVTKKL
ncbi:hypothetical protein [Chromobacterium haemolyticum]|uniref:hypothetical protein n=1 Tax=Chromobacterium haemolyticum TaxID=394935 RepID=UPI00307E6893